MQDTVRTSSKPFEHSRPDSGREIHHHPEMLSSGLRVDDVQYSAHQLLEKPACEAIHKRDASLITIRRKCFDVIIGAVIVVEIKMLEPYDLVKFNPFWQESGSIFEFHASR